MRCRILFPRSGGRSSLCRDGVIYRCKVIVCIYFIDLLRDQPCNSTRLLTTCRSWFSPIINTGLRNAPVQMTFANRTFLYAKPCVYGGADGHCPRVQSSVWFASPLHNIYYTTFLKKSKPLFFINSTESEFYFQLKYTMMNSIWSCHVRSCKCISNC